MANFWEPYLEVMDLQRPLTCPSVADLDRFEQRTGWSLPRSYRQLALTFGAGDFHIGGDLGGGTSFEYGVPEIAGAPRGGYSTLRDPEPSTGETPLVDRLVVFGGDGNSTVWGWDPHHVTDPEAHEYAIYRAADGRVEGGVRATSFQGFVLDTIFEGKLPPEALDADELDQINPPHEFQRYFTFAPLRVPGDTRQPPPRRRWLGHPVALLRVHCPATFWSPYLHLMELEDPANCPTTADLDAFESRTGLALPVRFREFALTFGAGSLNAGGLRDDQMFDIFMPAFAGVTVQQHPLLADPSPRSAVTPLGDRLVPFASDDGGLAWGWDPLAVTDPDAHEYAIHQVSDGEVGDDVVATSFTDFMLAVVFRGKIPPERLLRETLDEVNPYSPNERYFYFCPAGDS